MKRPKVEIDSGSGFCFGVVTAIRKAEEHLGKENSKLYCLGDIVHNAAEVARLGEKGLETISHSDLITLHDARVLLRAHGEPPSTYETAHRNGIEIIDATCPVVLQLQRRIKSAYDGMEPGTLILIYGKPGHAEVNGLVGQTNGEAVVVRDVSDLDNLDLSRNVRLFSQTTKSLDGFRDIVEEIKRRKQTLGGDFQWFDTICRQVANRLDGMREFARRHNVVLFVSGAKSSNGKVLFSECRKANTNSHMLSDINDFDPAWIEGAETIGICGATSTPHWLMAELAEKIEARFQNSEKSEN